MSSSVRKAEHLDWYCPDCYTCLEDAVEVCPECDGSRPPAGWEPLERSPHPYLGKIIGDRYALDRFLGGGASGRVYRANDVKLDRPFALKILELGGGDDDEGRLRRFEKEVEALSRIRNPHVINIFEALRLEGRAPAMLTEYIAGRTLRELLEEGKHLDIDSALLLIHQIANGLHEAHSRGVIHRDLKPANVMIEKLPATGSFARILDFGLVHITDDAGKTRGFWGTPLYAAPEQCSADGDISPASDIYSLGCVLFRCVAGRPPFVGDSGRELMRAHFEKPPPRLMRMAPQEVPTVLDELVQSMLCKKPVDRPDDMQSVIEEIDRLSESNRRLSASVVVSESDETGGASDEGRKTGHSKTESDRPETRQGMHQTRGSGPRLAQLLHRVDAASAVDGFRGDVRCARLDRTGNCAVFSDADHQLYVSSTRGAGYLQPLSPADGRLGAVVPDIEKGRILAAEREGRLLRWRLEFPTARPDTLDELDETVCSLALNSASEQLYVGTENGAVYRNDLRVGTRKLLHRFPDTVCALEIDTEAEQLLAATLDGAVTAFPTDGSAEPVCRETLETRPVAVETDPARDLTAILDGDDRLRLLAADRDGEAQTVEPAVDETTALSVAQGGELYLVSAREATVRVWRIRYEALARDP